MRKSTISPLLPTPISSRARPGQGRRRTGAMLAAICATAVMAAPAVAQPAPPPPPPEAAPAHGGPMGHPPKGDLGMHAMRPALINVTGTGYANVAPDMAVITIGVTVQAANAGEAMSQNASRQQAVIDAVKGSNIEARDIQTSNISLSPVQDYSQQGKPPVITGYQAGNMVTIRVRDLPKLGDVLDAIVAAGANEVQGISFQRDDAAKTEADARRNAVTNARDRAEVIAAAAGQRLGRLVALSDTQGPPQSPQPMMMRANMQSGDAKVPVEAGELRMSADVTATWEMLPFAGNEEGAEPSPVEPVPGEGQEPTPVPTIAPAPDAAPAASAPSN